MRAQGLVPRAQFADVEEHILDTASGTTLRCDVTVRDGLSPLLTIEMKRPELVDVDSPVLTNDAHAKALARGLPLFATCNFAEIALWRTDDGPQPQRPLERMPLALGLWHSSAAPSRRQEMQSNWRIFLDRVEAELETIDAAYAREIVTLPPQVADLREAVRSVAEETAVRIADAASGDVAFHDRVIATFSEQFGVELSLDPARPDVLNAEARQVASIACFIVASRLLLYQALSFGERGACKFELDRIEVPPAATDPGRVAHELAGLYAHARSRTHDFELQFTPSDLDEIAFVPSPSGNASDVGARWASLVDVVVRSDWTGPSQYVPALYESLLDEEHRHLMGVHYTPGALAEVLAAYAIQRAADVVMDPAAGAGTFAAICYDRKRALGSTHEQALAEVYAVEIADFAASLTGLSLALADASAPSAYPRVVKSDFFALLPGGPTGLTLPGINDVQMPQSIDAIVGNPPYVRFESRSPEERAEIHAVLSSRYAREGIAFPDFTGKADLWAFFVAQSHAYLREGGRLAFVLSWSLLCSNYGDAVLSFLSRYFMVDAIIDSRVERFFAAKQHVVLLFARRARDPGRQSSATSNPHIDSAHPVRFVRLKRPLMSMLRTELRPGKQGEDLMDELMAITTDVDDDPRWDVHVVAQGDLWRRETSHDDSEDDA